MQTKDCESWQDFKSCLEKVKQEVREVRKNALPGVLFPDLLYRGQSDSSWKLQTTLERCGDDLCDVYNFYKLIHSVRFEVETHFQKKWKIPTPLEWMHLLNSNEGRSAAALIANTENLYEYMVFLRHYGFPSPLLDWSRSPYVAAFFATRGIIKNKIGNFSIFAFLDSVGHGKVSSGKSSEGIDRIETLGPNVHGQTRHFLQQCEYTICTKNYSKSTKFICHENVAGPSNIIRFTPTIGTQDILMKFNIPGTEIPEVLNELNEFNLNAFSLFTSDDSFIESIAMRGMIKQSPKHF